MNDTQPRGQQVALFKSQLDKMEAQFRAALPLQIPSQKFIRVALTAVQVNQKLLTCSARSLFNELLKCANDGLLPDGREAAITEGFGNGEAVYMPMRAGILKRARNSGEIANWEVHAVHANDVFRYKLGDNAELHHEPALDEPGPWVRAYSICHLTSGEISRDVMSKREIELIRDRYSAQWRAFKAGKIKSAPWNDRPEEMACKTVLKHHAKMLPVSSDISTLIEYDNATDLEPESPRRGRPPKALIEDHAFNVTDGEQADRAEHEKIDEIQNGQSDNDDARQSGDGMGGLA